MDFIIILLGKLMIGLKKLFPPKIILSDYIIISPKKKKKLVFILYFYGNTIQI